MEESENLTLATNTTHQLHSFINPYDREGHYILFSGGHTEQKNIYRKTHSPHHYLRINDWHELKSVLPNFTPEADTYLLPYSPLSESTLRTNRIEREFIEYQDIYHFFEQQDIRQQRKSTLICLCMLLAENYDINLGGIPRGIKWLAAKLGTNSRKITVSIKSLEEMGLIVFHQKRADIDKVTLPCFIEPTRTFVLKFTSLFRKGKAKPKENSEVGTRNIHTTPEQDYESLMIRIAEKESMYDDIEKNLAAKKPDYYLHGKEGFFWYQNQMYTLKVRLLNLVRQPEVEEVIKVHAYRVLL
ncbi:hypothetical protein CKF94_15220 [Vibrio coralliilyticus]|uniref:hypothetical protein n=1 Tax=Vibrio coralliilyticus TaxID=190893 RepID=UPI000BAADE86|nr:hypothetical protein [Vibrio coralliilyticus]PAU37236.1 hypothetical protein CKF94_15220 [Vibrio coralliilyticus]